MRRRKLFGLAAGAAVVPVAAAAAPMVEMHVNDVTPATLDLDRICTVIVGFNEDDGYWWMRSQIDDWHELRRRTSLSAPPGWLDGLTRKGDVWRGFKIRPDVAERHARYAARRQRLAAMDAETSAAINRIYEGDDHA